VGKEKGKGTDPPSPAREKKSRDSLSPAREKKSRAGGAAARPLDGGVLTRWGARAPARGPATAPRLAPPPARSSSVARGCTEVERRERRASAE